MACTEGCLRIDLGSGRNAPPGFLGVDRYPLPGVAVVADLERPLPFADSSVDLISASHSLEHVHELMPVMREIWRIGTPGAQVAIIAPYGHQGLNLANPYHHQIFNEHTPRFWTDARDCPVPRAEWHLPPHGQNWGLASTANERPGLDLLCFRMEFLYFDRYRNLPVALQRRLRRRHLDVCDQIIYHLLVVKPPVIGEEIQRRLHGLEPFIPEWIEPRRGRRPARWRGRIADYLRTLFWRFHP